jgi:glutamine synthetase type III
MSAFTYDRQIAEEVKKLVMEDIETETGIIMNGNVYSVEEYRYHVGRSHGLKRILEAFDQAKSIVEKGDRRE